MEKKPAKGPGGRPTKYRPEFCQQVIECGEQGMSLAEMARLMAPMAMREAQRWRGLWGGVLCPHKRVAL